jgi:hypothetical protein
VSQFELAVIAIFFGIVVLRIAFISIVALMIIRPVRDCPACFRATIPVRRRWLNSLASAFEWRWCPACRWEGPALRLSPPQASLAPKTRRDPPLLVSHTGGCPKRHPSPGFPLRFS